MRKSIPVVLAFALTLILGGTAMATPPPDHKVGLCHRTASDTNPYVFIEVDVASLDAHLNNLPGHPAKTNEDGSPRNDYLANSAEDCAQPTASPEPTATPEPTESPDLECGCSGGPPPEESIEPLPDTAMEQPIGFPFLALAGFLLFGLGLYMAADSLSKRR